MKTLYLLALSITALQVPASYAQSGSPGASVVERKAESTNSPGRPQMRERGQIHGSEEIVTFFTDWRAEAASGGKTVRGAYREG